MLSSGSLGSQHVLIGREQQGIPLDRSRLLGEPGGETQWPADPDVLRGPLGELLGHLSHDLPTSDTEDRIPVPRRTRLPKEPTHPAALRMSRHG